jgi:chromosome partitioning protein
VVKRCPDIEGLFVVPATIDLAGAEIGLVATVSRETKLQIALNKFFKEFYVDYVIVDCPPSLGLLTLNALVAAKEIMIPIQCEYYALEGVTQLLKTIDLVTGRLNDELQLTTVVLTMFDARTNLSSQVADEVRNHFSAQTLNTVIPRSVRVAEAPSYAQTVLSYHQASAGAQAYLHAAEEIAQRGAQN